MCEQICGNCTKFRVDERGMPESLRRVSRNIFQNPDGTGRKIGSGVEFLLGLELSGLADYGHRGCEKIATATIGTDSCKHLESFEAKK